jgi:antitoxin (DNA-binding transcriptional repressor) of toxin-antitoxin stability system
MYCPQDETHRSFRDARADLSALCHAPTATTILDRNHPIAIIVPIEPSGYDRYTTKDKRLAAAKRRFDAALKTLRTPKQS